MSIHLPWSNFFFYAFCGEIFLKQESIQVGYASPTFWLYPIVSHVSVGGMTTSSLDADPLPLDADPLPLDADPPLEANY